MEYTAKVDHARKLIASVLSQAKEPCTMCSFGKDSIAVLHMVRQQADLPVVFHREPFQHYKYDYANSIIRDWDLHVVDYPPMATAVNEGETEFEIVNQYQAGNKWVYLPTGFRQSRQTAEGHGAHGAFPLSGNRKVLCAFDKVYNKPTGTFNYPFDIAFHGHKSVDVDPILGAVPLNSDVAFNVGAISAAFPLRHFTNADVWRYIEENGIPIHDKRYEKVNGEWREREDKTHNPDYIDACYACMSKKTGSSVYCPKLQCGVSNISAQLRRQEAFQLEYIKN